MDNNNNNTNNNSYFHNHDKTQATHDPELRLPGYQLYSTAVVMGGTIQMHYVCDLLLSHFLISFPLICFNVILLNLS